MVRFQSGVPVRSALTPLAPRSQTSAGSRAPLTDCFIQLPATGIICSGQGRSQLTFCALLLVDLAGHNAAQLPYILPSPLHDSYYPHVPTITTSPDTLDSPEVPSLQLDDTKYPPSDTLPPQEERSAETFIAVEDVAPATVTTKELSDQPEMKQVKTKATIGVLSTLIAYVSVNSWFKTHHPEVFYWSLDDRENDQWVATSKSWWDRKACRWLGVCGGAHMHFTHQHLRPQGLRTPVVDGRITDDEGDWQTAWTGEESDRPEDLTDDEKVLGEMPQYVLDYAPLVHLFSGEQYWPCDIAEHLYHVTPELNYTAIESSSQHLSLKDLDKFNEYERGRWVFLTSNDDVEDHPSWLGGEKNIPNLPQDPDDDFADNDGWVHHPGRTYYQGLMDVIEDVKEWFGAGESFKDDADLRESATAAKERARLLLESEGLFHKELKRDENEPDRLRGGRSDAPAILIAINKGHGVVDAFWFFFYSFNLGNTVFNVRFGNHVGDWEHTAIRFHHGEPKAVFFSEHNFGSAYSYEAVEKYGKRPVIYSAVGTHAMYATSGLHPYILPWGILHDQTDKGPLWDPALNSHMFTYDTKKDTLRASNVTPTAPTSWFHFAGRWGDKFYPLGDKRQYRFAGQYHYVSGPLGPKFKNLARKKICGGPDKQPCVIKHWLGGENRAGRLEKTGHEPDMYTAQEAERLSTLYQDEE